MTKQERQEKRDRIRELCRTICKMSGDERKAMAAKMKIVRTVEGRILSVFNTCFILAQGGIDVTLVGGFQQWKKNSRSVSKGQHGYAIWCPSFPKESAEDEEVDEKTKFFLGYVFDVSQTEEIENEAHLEATAVPIEEPAVASV